MSFTSYEIASNIHHVIFAYFNGYTQKSKVYGCRKIWTRYGTEYELKVFDANIKKMVWANPSYTVIKEVID